MSKRKFSLIVWYRMFFLSERTATISALLALPVMLLALYFGIRSGSLNLSDVYDMLSRFLLVVTLSYSMRKHNLLLMQAATVGMLFVMLCSQSQYALCDLVQMDSEIYITMGLQGFVFLSVEQMILFLETLVCIDYFVIHVAGRQGPTLLYVNRSAIVFLMALLVVQLAIAPTLSFDLMSILFVWAVHLGELIMLVLLVCAEVIILVDSRELVGE